MCSIMTLCLPMQGLQYAEELVTDSAKLLEAQAQPKPKPSPSPPLSFPPLWRELCEGRYSLAVVGGEGGVRMRGCTHVITRRVSEAGRGS